MAAEEPFLPKGCLAGCASLALLAVALTLFDWHIVGAACALLLFATLCGGALAKQRFGWAWGEYRRDEQPFAYWLSCAATAALTILNLIRLIDEIAIRGVAP